MNDAALLEIPEAALAAADHLLGNAPATVALLEYGDYECPTCIQAEPLIQHVVDTYGGQPRLVFLHFPWVKVRPNAELAAEVASRSWTRRCRPQ